MYQSIALNPHNKPLFFSHLFNLKPEIVMLLYFQMHESFSPASVGILRAHDLPQIPNNAKILELSRPFPTVPILSIHNTTPLKVLVTYIAM